MAAATGQASCVLREMGLGPRDRCTVENKCSKSCFLYKEFLQYELPPVVKELSTNTGGKKGGTASVAV